jgi:hypothetical protein
MDATLIVIDSDAELSRARALVDRLLASNDPANIARLEAQARLIAAYKETKSSPDAKYVRGHQLLDGSASSYTSGRGADPGDPESSE